MAISLAVAVCLFAHHRRFSLHGFNARPFDRVVSDQIVNRNKRLERNFADAFRRRAWFRNVRAGMVGNFGLRPGFRARVVHERRAFAMDCAVARVARIHSSVLDR